MWVFMRRGWLLWVRGPEGGVEDTGMDNGFGGGRGRIGKRSGDRGMGGGRGFRDDGGELGRTMGPLVYREVVRRRRSLKSGGGGLERLTGPVGGGESLRVVFEGKILRPSHRHESGREVIFAAAVQDVYYFGRPVL